MRPAWPSPRVRPCPRTAPPTSSSCAARWRYDMGELTVTALGGGPDPGAGRVRGGARPLRKWQDHAPEHDRRPGLPDRGRRRDRRPGHHERRPLRAFRIRRHEISFIFQTFNLFPALTALENVEFGARGRGAREPARRSPDDARARRARGADRALPARALGRRAAARCDRAALAGGNPILLADEPTGELDFQTGVQILDLLHEQTHEQGTAVLIVTHNREIACRPPCDRAARAAGSSPTRPTRRPVDVSELRW